MGLNSPGYKQYFTMSVFREFYMFKHRLK